MLCSGVTSSYLSSSQVSPSSLLQMVTVALPLPSHELNVTTRPLLSSLKVCPIASSARYTVITYAFSRVPAYRCNTTNGLPFMSRPYGKSYGGVFILTDMYTIEFTGIPVRATRTELSRLAFCSGTIRI